MICHSRNSTGLYACTASTDVCVQINKHPILNVPFEFCLKDLHSTVIGIAFTPIILGVFLDERFTAEEAKSYAKTNQSHIRLPAVPAHSGVF